jgi:opacity protein-like surface antigen
VQPYVGAGLSAVYVSVDVEPQGSDRVSDWGLEDGLDLLAGVHWRTSPKNGVFFEFRYTHVEVDLDPRGFLFDNLIQRIRADVDTQRLLIGWSHRPGG